MIGSDKGKIAIEDLNKQTREINDIYIITGIYTADQFTDCK